MQKCEETCLNVQFARYMRSPIINSNRELVQRITEFIGEQKYLNVQNSSSGLSSGFQQIEQRNSIPSEIISEAQEEKQLIKKGEQVQKQDERSSENRQCSIIINGNILDLIKSNHRILLGGTFQEEEKTLTISGFMNQQKEWNKEINLHQIFAKEERKFVGIGMTVQNDIINAQDLLYLKNQIKEKGLILLINTKTNIIYLLELTNQEIKETNQNISFSEKSFYFQTIAKGKDILSMIDQDENVKTKQIKTTAGNQIPDKAKIDTKGENVKKVFEYKFASELKNKAGKPQGWGFVLFPEDKENTIRKYQQAQRFEVFLDIAAKNKGKPFIPVCRFGQPKGVIPFDLALWMWENSVDFGGISNTRHLIHFFRVVSNPSGEYCKDNDPTIQRLKEGTLESIKLVSIYDNKSYEESTIKHEQIK